MPVKLPPAADKMHNGVTGADPGLAHSVDAHRILVAAEGEVSSTLSGSIGRSKHGDGRVFRADNAERIGVGDRERIQACRYWVRLSEIPRRSKAFC